METYRFILILSVGLVFALLWQAWQQDYAAPPGQMANVPGQVANAPLTPVPAPSDGIDNSVYDIPSQPKKSQGPQLIQAAPADVEARAARLVTVETDVYTVEIDLHGGTLRQVSLTQYPLAKDKPTQPVVLLDDSQQLFYIAQGGLLSQQSAPTHASYYSAPQSNYTMPEGDSMLMVPLSWQSDDGITVTKIFRFQRGDYRIGIDYQITNDSGRPWQGQAYDQLQRAESNGNGENRFIYTYTGVVISSPEERYTKISFSDMESEPFKQSITNGWAAMLQHYFLAALLPTETTTAEYYYTRVINGNRYVVGAIGQDMNIPAGESNTLKRLLYIGPKEQERLQEIAEGLNLTVDYGIFWIIAKPLFWCLSALHDYTKNWGWSIILMTISLKLLFFHLSAVGYRSMANMRRLQPRLLALRERHKGDRARMNQAMMEFYKKEKLNPLGGCLPILVQIPVFISLYWVLLESVEMRQADFMFWLNDLSSPDPFYVLPLIMGITMFVQQKLNPAPLDPVQAKVFALMPVIFTVFFAFFPSGLVLYWVTNNILSIAQQWAITRRIEKQLPA